MTESGSTVPLGTATVIGEEWKIRVNNLTSVPCKVKATHSDGRTHEKRVKKAPRNCTNGDDTNSPPTANANGSVHYQQGGAFPEVTNILMSFASAGK